jgi:Lanthionine-containing peptide SapB precursor RamS
MTLLDLQTMASNREDGDRRCGGSDVSLLLCDSVASVTLCLLRVDLGP